jgi:hypothetical protein
MAIPPDTEDNLRNQQKHHAQDAQNPPSDADLAARLDHAAGVTARAAGITLAHSRDPKSRARAHAAVAAAGYAKGAKTRGPK